MWERSVSCSEAGSSMRQRSPHGLNHGRLSMSFSGNFFPSGNGGASEGFLSRGNDATCFALQSILTSCMQHGERI